MDQAVPTTLYRFYDAADRLLYVGITSVGPNRWGSHEQRDWWSLVARVTTEHFPDRSSALAAEQAAIRSEGPKHNIVHATPRQPHPPRVYRSHGTGSLVQRQDGRWQVAFQEAGKRRYWIVRDQIGGELVLAVIQGRGASLAAKRKAIAILEEPS